MIENRTDAPIQKKGRGGKRPGAGRPKGALGEATIKINAAKATLRDLAAEHVPMAVQTLANIARSSQSDQAKVAAIKELLDRAYGKAPQAHTGEEGEGPIRHVLEVVWKSSGPA